MRRERGAAGQAAAADAHPVRDVIVLHVVATVAVRGEVAVAHPAGSGARVVGLGRGDPEAQQAQGEQGGDQPLHGVVPGVRSTGFPADRVLMMRPSRSSAGVMATGTAMSRTYAVVPGATGSQPAGSVLPARTARSQVSSRVSSVGSRPTRTTLTGTWSLKTGSRSVTTMCGPGRPVGGRSFGGKSIEAENTAPNRAVARKVTSSMCGSETSTPTTRPGSTPKLRNAPETAPTSSSRPAKSRGRGPRTAGSVACPRITRRSPAL